MLFEGAILGAEHTLKGEQPGKPRPKSTRFFRTVVIWALIVVGIFLLGQIG